MTMYYCQLHKVNDFKTLHELIVLDKMFSSLDHELMSHISVKQGESHFTPLNLGKEYDIYLAPKGKNKAENLFIGTDSNKRFTENK